MQARQEGQQGLDEAPHLWYATPPLVCQWNQRCTAEIAGLPTPSTPLRSQSSAWEFPPATTHPGPPSMGSLPLSQHRRFQAQGTWEPALAHRAQGIVSHALYMYIYIHI